MPAWPGGACPECGEMMPEKLIHCQSCRALLNPDLNAARVPVPAFQPLREIHAMIEVEPSGYYIGCPNCRDELRINRKYLRRKVLCKHCHAPFVMDVSSDVLDQRGFYATCPYCNEELRAAAKYMGEKVACKHCNGQIHFVGKTL